LNLAPAADEFGAAGAVAAGLAAVVALLEVGATGLATAAGLIAAGFGSGAALFITPIAHIIQAQDYRAAFLYTGIVQGILIVAAAQFLGNPAKPPAAVATSARVRSRGEDFNSLEMLRTPHFYLMFAMAVMMGIGGLMATAQVGPMSKTLKYSAAILTLSLTVNPLANGGGRLFWGAVSDWIGREHTMMAAFFLQAVILLSVVKFGKLSPQWFVVTIALVFFTWGEVYSLFPSACADFFGAKNASSNYSFIYAAKGVASIMGGGLAAKLFERTGSWDYGFYACAVLALCSSAMAFGLRKMPLPRKAASSQHATA